jgi:hypothetical protein
MTHDQLHTHGPDELAMLRAECDKWHKAYDRVWEERMRFADRAIELSKRPPHETTGNWGVYQVINARTGYRTYFN